MTAHIRLLFLLLLVASSPALAQTDDPLGGRDTIVLENERIQDVIDSDKPFYKADYQEISSDIDEQLTYESEAFYIETDFDPAPPEVKPIQPDPFVPNANNLLRLGIGRFVTPMGQLFLHNGPDDRTDYGLNLTHRSAYRDQIELRRFSQTYGGVHGQVNQDIASIGGGISFYQTGYFNYAGDTLLALDSILTDSLSPEALQQQVEDSLRMSFFHLQGDLSVISRNQDRLFYDVGARVRLHTDRRDNQEFHISTLPSVSYSLTDQVDLGLGSEFTYVRGRIDTNAQNRLFLHLLPKLSFHSERFQGHVGVRYDFFNNSVDSNGIDLLVPEIRLQVAAIPGALDIFAGYTGGMDHVHYYGMITENPYVATDVDIRPTRTAMNVFLGVDGNVAQDFNIAGKVYYQRINDQLIYRTNDSIFFQPTYDSLMTVTGAHLEVNYDPSEHLSLGAALNVNVYQTSNQDSLTPAFFHAAPFQLDLYGSYRLMEDKLTLQGKATILGATPVSVDANDNVINRTGFFGLQVAGDYRITDQVSVFLAIDNLAGLRYQRWYFYPERQFDIRGGITWAF